MGMYHLMKLLRRTRRLDYTACHIGLLERAKGTLRCGHRGLAVMEMLNVAVFTFPGDTDVNDLGPILETNHYLHTYSSQSTCQAQEEV